MASFSAGGLLKGLLASYRARRYLTLAGASGLGWASGGLPAAQWIIFVLTVAWIVFRLFFVLDLARKALLGNPVVFGLIVGFYLMLVGLVGADYGVMNLFWHEDLLTRLAASFFTTLFFGLMFLTAFYSDPDRASTRRRHVDYLSDPRTFGETAKANLRALWGMVVAVWNWLRRQGWKLDPPPVRPVAIVSGDVVAVQDDIERFLKVWFHPFWLLLLLPAVAPAVYAGYANVPKTLPSKLAGFTFPLFAKEANDVTSNLFPWLVGIAIWGVGLLAGRFVIWSYVEVNRRLFGVLPRASRGDATLRSIFDGIVERICPMEDAAWSDQPPPGFTAKGDVQRAVVRFTTTLFGLYWLAILAHLVLTSRRWPGLGDRGEDAMYWASVAGAAILLVGFIGMGLFLRSYAGSLRQELQGEAGKSFYLNCHRALAMVMGLGVVLAGMSSAVFQVFLTLAVVANVLLILQLSRTWNWPVRVAPLSIVLSLLLVAIVGFTNNSPSKLRLPGLEGRYAEGKRGDLKTSAVAGQQDGPGDDEAVLCNWLCNVGTPKPKLAVMAVSGGANRAAFWTAKVLGELDAIPGFRRQLRVITGASGGMVGAAYYVAALQDGSAPAAPVPDGPGAAVDTAWLLSKLRTDSLTPVVRQWMLGDTPLSFWPWDVSRAWDRGLTLERTWPELSVSFQTLKPLEDEGKIPSLIFSPMLVEDGRQLLISNLNLAFMTNSMGGMLDNHPESPRIKWMDPTPGLYSYPSVELFRTFPEARDAFSLATAVRLNASFPYVSPALYLPTEPYRRVVDAGYYDNYGIATAASWIFRHRAWLRDNTSGVVLIQVRAYPKQVSRTEFVKPETGILAGLGRAFEFLTSPGTGATNSRDAATLFRNDQVVEALSKWFREQESLPNRDLFFTTALFEYAMDVSMTWYTTDQERALVDLGFGAEESQAEAGNTDPKVRSAIKERTRTKAEPIIDSLDESRKQAVIDGMIANREALEKLRLWWGDGTPAAKH